MSIFKQGNSELTGVTTANRRETRLGKWQLTESGYPYTVLKERGCTLELATLHCFPSLCTMYRVVTNEDYLAPGLLPIQTRGDRSICKDTDNTIAHTHVLQLPTYAPNLRHNLMLFYWKVSHCFNGWHSVIWSVSG